MSDLISRQAAMEYPLSWEHYDKEHGDSKFICGVESYREYIEHLPSADRPKGEWIAKTPFTGICDNCGHESNLKDKYCPNCGADMRGEQND